MLSSQAIIYLMLNVGCDTFGQIAFKLASQSTGDDRGKAHWLGLARSPFLWLGIIAFVFELLFWLSFLAEVPLAMGLFIGCINIASVVISGHLLFNEPLPRDRLIAIVLILVGVMLVGWGGA
jgi:multidrug transporter EmrE-like cation transporter